MPGVRLFFIMPDTDVNFSLNPDDNQPGQDPLGDNQAAADAIRAQDARAAEDWKVLQASAAKGQSILDSASTNNNPAPGKVPVPPSPSADLGYGSATGGYVSAASRNTRAINDFLDGLYIDDSPYSEQYPRYNSAEQADQTKADILTSVRNRYTVQNRYGEIGGKAFLADVQEDLVSAGLASVPTEPVIQPLDQRMIGNLRSGLLEGGGLNLAYGGFQAAQGVEKAFSPQLEGTYFQQDQANEQSLSSLIPLVTTGIGALGFGGPGALAGGFVGAPIKAAIDAYEDTNVFGPERTGQILGAGRGGSPEIQDFVDAIKNAATPAVKELADTLQKLGQSGPVSPGAAAQFSIYQGNLGAGFSPSQEGLSKFLDSSPALAGVREAYGTSPYDGMSASEYNGIASAAALTGNYSGMTGALAFARYAPGGSGRNPYTRDSDFVQRFESKNSFTDGLYNLFHPSLETDYDQAKERLKTETPPPVDNTAANLQKVYEQYQVDQTTIGTSGSLVGGALTGLQSRLLSGAGPSAYADALPGIQANIGNEDGAYNTQITALRKAAAANPALAPFLNQQIAQDQAQQAQADLVLPTLRRAQVMGETDLEKARYGLSLTNDTLNGASASSLEGIIDKQAGYLSGLHDYLSPAEIAANQTQAANMRYGAQQAVYSQTLGGIDNSIAGAQAGIAQQQAFGTPGGVYGAQGQELTALTSKLAELREEVSRGNLTYDDRLQKEREISQTNAQIASQSAARRNDFFDASASIGTSNFSADTASLSRNLAISGQSAITPGILQDQRELIGTYGSALAAAPAGSVEQAQRRAQLSGAQNDLQNLIGESQTYRPSADLQGRLSDASTAFEVGRITPYSSGSPSSNPFTAGLAYEQMLGTERNQTLAAGRSATDPLARLADQQQANQLSVQIAGLEKERVFNGFEAFPEMIEGSPGKGILAGIMPTAGMAAMFSPQYNPTLGSFGSPPAQSFGPGAGMMRDGGTSGAAFMAAGGANVYSSGGPRDSGTSQIVAAIREQTQALRALLGSKSGNGSAGGARYYQSNTLLPTGQ